MRAASSLTQPAWQHTGAQAIELDPKNAYAWGNLGQMDGGVVKGQTYTATNCFEMAVQLDPLKSCRWRKLGKVCLTNS